MDAGQIRSQPEASQWEALPTSVYLRLCLARGEEAPCVCVCVWWWGGGSVAEPEPRRWGGFHTA